MIALYYLARPEENGKYMTLMLESGIPSEDPALCGHAYFYEPGEGSGDAPWYALPASLPEVVYLKEIEHNGIEFAVPCSKEDAMWVARRTLPKSATLTVEL